MEFKIARGQGKCSITGRKFEDGEKFIVALSADPAVEGTFVRRDICQEAWDRQPPGAFTAWWASQHSAARKPVLLDPDLLWQIFHNARAEQTGEARYTPVELNRFAYVAALGLMRLKKLKLKGTRRQGKQEFLIFETPGKAKERAEYEVKNPELDEAGVEAVQDKLADLA
ncbi:MAG: hypothetical protein KF754_09780 [Planctomycetes bacterium]|nr:hypothetical protein [Planctomycetota bacterium]